MVLFISIRVQEEDDYPLFWHNVYQQHANGKTSAKCSIHGQGFSAYTHLTHRTLTCNDAYRLMRTSVNELCSFLLDLLPCFGFFLTAKWVKSDYFILLTPFQLVSLLVFLFFLAYFKKMFFSKNGKIVWLTVEINSFCWFHSLTGQKFILI